MASGIITAHVSENGQSPYALTIDVGGHQLLGDEPAEAGGAGLGPSPFELLTSALAECTAMTVRWYALQQKWPLAHIEVIVTHQKGGEGANSPRQDVFTKSITLTGDLTAEQQAKLLDVSGKCPIQRVLEGTPLIRTQVKG